MRVRFSLVLSVALVAATAQAKDVFLSIGGSVGAFKTDMRIFNPSTTKDIQVQAYLLPVGGVDNSGVTPKTITVPKRQMVVYDDVLTSLFASTGLAGIRLSSTDDFVATQRIFAVTSSGTLGQFVPGLDSTQALKNGVIIQLKSSTGFRTNLGVINPNNATANTSWYLYDKNNALIGPTKTLTLPPYAVISPQEIKGFFGGASADLSDAWVAYTSDQPLIAYGSVVDNGTTDPTYITASNDSGSSGQQTTTPKTLTVTEQNNLITISGANTLAVGDVVNVTVSVSGGPHGFALLDPNGVDVIPEHGATTPGTSYTETFTVSKTGTYSYFCTNAGCGAHAGMSGTFDIGQPSGGHNPGY